MKDYQVIIIGGGVIGSAIAWELSKYHLQAAVIEKGTDVAQGVSKANSGVIHSGINSPPGSLKARFCLEGNRLFPQIAQQLNLPIKWIGKYIIAQNDDELDQLYKLEEIGKKNNITGLQIHDKKTVIKHEPNVNCITGLWVPSAGITLPYICTIAFAESAIMNGIHFFLENEVIKIQKQQNHFTVQTTKKEFITDVIINATGLNCRNIISMVEKPNFNIYPCRGEYLVLDKTHSLLITSMIYPTPVQETGVLGVHITPTIEGNILIGPSAEFIEEIDDTQTTNTTMNRLFIEAQNLIPTIPKKAIINTYAGIRCKLAPPEQGGWADYQIYESTTAPGMINLVGIESPGLTAAPAIAIYVTNMIKESIQLKPKQKIKPRPQYKQFINLPQKTQETLLHQDTRWGHIICRCEHITEREIINALTNPLGAQTVSSVKFRCRAGMGRCQGGFCTPHIVKIMNQQFNINITDMLLHGPNSTLFTRKNREEP